MKSKGEKERYTHLKAEFQRIARRDTKVFLSDKCKEIERNNRMGKTRDLFKEIRDTEGGNRQNRLCLESRTPSWAGLWTLSSMPNFYANDIPTGKPGPRKEEPQGLYRDSPGLKE